MNLCRLQSCVISLDLLGSSLLGSLRELILHGKKVELVSYLDSDFLAVFCHHRCVLAGDHLQLPPTILSTEAAKQGLEVTLMERLIKLLGDGAVHMLTTQYRLVKIQHEARSGNHTEFNARSM